MREDYLRILRFFRFHAWYGGDALDAEGLAACAELAEGIRELSRERIGHEMRRLLAAPDPAPSVAAMEAAGVLMRVLPGSSSGRLAVMVHLEGEAGATPVWLRRLAALGGPDPAEALRLSKSEARGLAILTEAQGADTGPGELGYRLGAEAARDVLLLRSALMVTPWDEEAARTARHGAGQSFPLRAADLADRHSGPALGRALKEAEARWIASGFTLGKEALLR
ncbi:hypothetical protein [Histidinibacterium lentulum]|uniref:hypothetical protein n=1 Tax=Histidinibacterium lentulum TaxID=2480588 RepID=UPI003CCC8ADB